MTHPEGRRSVKVGIRLTRQVHDLGAWLSDAAAFDAAGAHALWVDLPRQPRLDPLAVTAALAAVTYRSLLVTALPGPDEASPAVAATLATIGRLSHGRLMIVADVLPARLLAGIDPMPGFLRRIPGDPETFIYVHEIVDSATEGVEAPEGDDAPEGMETAESWASTALPDSRATWQAALHDAVQRQLVGLVVPAHPRMVDILRNPDELDDRRDLQLAVG